MHRQNVKHLFAHAVFTSWRREFPMSLLDTLQMPPTRVCNSSRIHERDEQRHRQRQNLFPYAVPLVMKTVALEEWDNRCDADGEAES
jgi:hypothetical protein